MCQLNMYLQVEETANSSARASLSFSAAQQGEGPSGALCTLYKIKRLHFVDKWDSRGCENFNPESAFLTSGILS